MQSIYPFAELDPDTADYLQTVHREAGQNAPGVYAPLKARNPVAAAIAAPIFLAAALYVAYRFEKGPAAVAMIQAAGLFPALWLVVYVLRRWVGQGTDDFPGRFVFFDPCHAYQVFGERVQVTPVGGVEAVTAVPGDEHKARVKFDFDDGDEVVVEVPSAKAARRVERYYGVLADLESREGEWAQATDAQRGAAAALAARTKDQRDLPARPPAVDRDFEPVPDDPRRAGRRTADVGGVVGPLASLACGAALFGLLWLYHARSEDDRAFDLAVAGGPPALRGYLVDPRHVKHRDEARRQIAAAYADPLNRLKAAPPGSDPALRAGMIRLVESLREADQGVLSIAVRDAGRPAPFPAPHLQREIADSLARSVGPHLLAFVEAPPDTPAHVDVAYKVVAGDGRADVTVDIALRADPAADPLARGTVQAVEPGPDVRPLVRNVVCRELAGGTTSPPPVVDGGDF